RAEVIPESSVYQHLQIDWPSRSFHPDRHLLVRLEIHSLRQPVHYVPNALPIHLLQQVARLHPRPLGRRIRPHLRHHRSPRRVPHIHAVRRQPKQQVVRKIEIPHHANGSERHDPPWIPSASHSTIALPSSTPEIPFRGAPRNSRRSRGVARL